MYDTYVVGNIRLKSKQVKYFHIFIIMRMKLTKTSEVNKNSA